MLTGIEDGLQSQDFTFTASSYLATVGLTPTLEVGELLALHHQETHQITKETKLH
jgi:hypothetical protein